MIRQPARLNFVTDDRSRLIDFHADRLSLEEFCQTLKSKGVEVSPVSMGMDNSRQAPIADPDGNPIELMEYGP